MSELATLTGAAVANADVLPGHVISPYSLAEMGESEKEFELNHLDTISKSITRTNPPATIASAMIQEAQTTVACSAFAWGTMGYWTRFAVSNHLPFLLYLALRQKDPKMTPQAAATLITPENYRAVQDAVRRAAGWKPAPNAQGPAATNAPASETPSPSPGEKSSDSSPKTSDPTSSPA